MKEPGRFERRSLLAGIDRGLGLLICHCERRYGRQVDEAQQARAATPRPGAARDFLKSHQLGLRQTRDEDPPEIAIRLGRAQDAAQFEGAGGLRYRPLPRR